MSTDRDPFLDRPASFSGEAYATPDQGKQASPWVGVVALAIVCVTVVAVVWMVAG